MPGRLCRTTGVQGYPRAWAGCTFWGTVWLDSGGNGTPDLWRHSAAGVSFYVIDTGMRMRHVEFAGRAVSGYDAVGDGRMGEDCNGHGTHLTGTIGGSTYGVAKQAKIVSVRVLDCNG